MRAITGTSTTPAAGDRHATRAAPRGSLHAVGSPFRSPAGAADNSQDKAAEAAVPGYYQFRALRSDVLANAAGQWRAGGWADRDSSVRFCQSLAWFALNGGTVTFPNQLVTVGKPPR